MQRTMNAAPVYRHGVPCWVDVLAPDPDAAARFYAELFGWEFQRHGRMPDGGTYLLATLGGDDVAGIAQKPAGAHAHWATYVHVDDVDAALRTACDGGGSVVVPALDARPAGRFAVIEDPAGATIALWEPGTRRGARRVNEPCAWAMSALRCADLDGASRFYAEVFGWATMPFAAGGASGVLYRVPGYVGGLPQQPVPRDVVAAGLADPSIAQAHWSVDFWIDDVARAVDRVARLGGTVLRAPFAAPPFRRAVVADPDGAIFTLSQLQPEAL